MSWYIASLTAAIPTGSTQPLVSAPTNHEVAGYMPGRLEFEHEVDNDAELVVKDFEFGLVYRYGGDEQPEATVTRPTEEEEEDEGETSEKKNASSQDVKVKEEPVDPPEARSVSPKKDPKTDDPALEFEDEDELEVKLAMLDIYFSKLDKREEAKDLIFDRGLTEYKKVGPSAPALTTDPSDGAETAERRKGNVAAVQSVCQAANRAGL